MAPEVFFVTTTIPARAGFVTMAVVTEFDTLAELNDALIEDRTIYCAQLMFDKENGQRIVKSARPCILGQATVASVTPFYDAPGGDELDRVLKDFDWGGNADEDGADVSYVTR